MSRSVNPPRETQLNRKSGSELRSRLATAIIGIPLVGVALWAGSGWWTVLVLLIASLGIWEGWRLLAIRGWEPAGDTVVVSGGLLGLIVYVGVSSWAFGEALFHPFPVAGLAWPVWGGAAGVAYAIMREIPRPHGWLRVAALVGGVAWVSATLAHLILLRQLSAGGWWVMLALGITWSSDVGAFFVGRRVKGPPLAPRISPNKTVSGSVGGLLAGGLFAVSFAPTVLGVSFGWAACLGVGAAAAGQIGDLVESVFKRTVGAKDSGGLLPGHGGILDRFDSLMFSAPFVFYFQHFLF